MMNSILGPSMTRKYLTKMTIVTDMTRNVVLCHAKQRAFEEQKNPQTCHTALVGFRLGVRIRSFPVGWPGCCLVLSVITMIVRVGFDSVTMLSLWSLGLAVLVVCTALTLFRRCTTLSGDRGGWSP